MTVYEYLLDSCPWCGSESREVRTREITVKNFDTLTFHCANEWHDNPWTIPQEDQNTLSNKKEDWVKFKLNNQNA